MVGAGEAEEIGFLHRVVPAAEAEESALELARQVAAGRPEGLRQLKAMFRRLGADADRVAYENELLMAFQREGAGLPRGA